MYSLHLLSNSSPAKQDFVSHIDRYHFRIERASISIAWNRGKYIQNSQIRGTLKYGHQAKIAGFLVGENHRKSHKRF